MAEFRGVQGTLLGPLTTTWSMPDSCTIHVIDCITCVEGYRGQQCVISDERGIPQDHTTCWPPAIQRAGTPVPAFNGWGFYSPGLACPTGYTAACTAEYSGRSDWAIEFPLIAGETAIGCCPTGFECTNHNGNTCIATAPDLVAQTGSCSGTVLVNLAQVTNPAFIDITATVTDDTSTGTVETSAPFTLFAPMFQLNYRASDLASSTAPPSTTGRSSASDDTTSVASQSTGSGAASPGSSGAAADGGGLSTGAIVGIAVGAALGGILLGVLAVLWFIRNRKRKQAEAAAEMDAQGAPGGHQPQSDHQQQYGYHPQYDHKYAGTMLSPNQQTPAEVWSQPSRVEVGSESAVVEMPNHGGFAGPPVELPTGNGRWSHNHTPTTPYHG